MKSRTLLLLMLALGMAPALYAEITLPRWFLPIKHWVDVSDSTGCDTAYVKLAEEGFIAYLNHWSTGTWVHAGVDPSLASTSSLTTATHPSQSLSLSVAYRGWGLSYAFTRDNAWCDDDFTYSFNARRYGLDYRYHSTRSLGDDARAGRMRTTSATAYWVFQRRYFSHPGAMLHTTYQLRSAGSWLAGVNYWHGSFRSYALEGSVPFSRLSFSHINIGAGYAYNYVFGQRHCLLHASLIPMLNVWHRNRLYNTMADGRRLHQSLSLDAVSRVGFVYNFDRYLMGVQYCFDYSFSPCEESLVVHALDYTQRFFVGVRF